MVVCVGMEGIVFLLGLEFAQSYFCVNPVFLNGFQSFLCCLPTA